MEIENRVVKFYLGEETKPVIEGIERLNDSIFRYQIQQALRVVASRIEPSNHPSEILTDEDNNVVAFVGERGAGKTSCMYSAIRILDDISDVSFRNHHNEALISSQSDIILSKKRFSFIKTIDPSFFDMKHNILEMIIGKMYAHIRDRISNYDQLGEEKYLSGELLKAFNETKTHLRYLTSDTKYENDTMEELAYLASGVDLKESIRKLISAYLKYESKDILVISLDDIDLNTSQAYRMVEQIRKYLILPNVVIFMAIKLEQLSDVIQLELCKQFQNMLSVGQISYSEVVEMAERYLMKLIPLQSRIYLPMPETFFERPLEIYQIRDSGPDKFDSIKRAVPELIFNKCRYLFYNTRGTTSMIVPRNLRELRLLINMLYTMPPYEKNTNKTLGNKQLFKRYFFGSWLDTLSKESRDVAYAILAENEPTLFNKTVIRQLVKLYFPDETLIPEKYKDIVDIRNLAFNVSLGDCFYFMDYIGNINLNTETQKLLFFIKSVYSIRLYEYYDELTDGLRNNIIPQDNRQPKLLSKTEVPYRTESLEDISSYEKFIGGSLYLLEGDSLISPQRLQGRFINRELRLINGEKLFEWIKELKTNPVDPQKKDETDEAYKTYITKLRLTEFFMLTISRYVWTTNTTLEESGIHKYRLISPAYYDRRIYESVSSLCFDVLTPLFTLLDIRHAYSRFDDEIYSIALQYKDSLASTLLSQYGKEEKEKEARQERFLSKIGLRNAEIIEDIFTHLKLKRRAWGQSSDNIKVLKNFYKSLSEYEIASYDYETTDNPAQKLYHIQLQPFNEFDKLLGEISSEEFDKIFIVGKEKKEDPKWDSIKKTFSEFLNTYNKMQQSTIVDILKKYNEDFFNFIGEDKIKEKFPPKITFTKQNRKDKLLELCNENSYPLQKEESITKKQPETPPDHEKLASPEKQKKNARKSPSSVKSKEITTSSSNSEITEKPIERKKRRKKNN